MIARTGSVSDVEDQIVYIAIDDVIPSPENDALYRPIHADDVEVVELSKSIRKLGLKEPIVITLDRYILSGHRRFAACRLAGMTVLPVRFEQVSRSSHLDEFTVLLREYNRQRVKSIDEQVREAVIDADPEEVRAELIEYRRQRSEVGHDPLSMNEARTRKRISAAKKHFMEAIVGVLNERRQFWPLSDRQIHYALLNNPPLKHAGKPDSHYRNDSPSYKSLVDLLTRLRITGQIPFEAIGDETRPFTNWDVHREPGGFIRQEIDDFLKGYFRDLMQSQPNHIEVVVEKNTVAGIIRPVCSDYCIPMTSGRGYCSLPPRNDMARRFRESGKEKLIVLLITDFDPDGESIAESFARSMRDDFCVTAIHPIKVALNYAQVQLLNLRPNLEVKQTSSRSGAFVTKYGRHVWELEALPPESLQVIVRDAIENVIDIDLFRLEQERETTDAVKLRAIRVSLQESLGNLASNN